MPEPTPGAFLTGLRQRSVLLIFFHRASVVIFGRFAKVSAGAMARFVIVSPAAGREIILRT